MRVVRPGLYPGAKNPLANHVPKPGIRPRPLFGPGAAAELALLVAANTQERLAIKIAEDIQPPLTDDNTEHDEESRCIVENEPP